MKNYIKFYVLSNSRNFNLDMLKVLTLIVNFTYSNNESNSWLNHPI